jgi:hypothetical protein
LLLCRVSIYVFKTHFTTLTSLFKLTRLSVHPFASYVLSCWTNVWSLWVVKWLGEVRWVLERTRRKFGVTRCLVGGATGCLLVWWASEGDRRKWPSSPKNVYLLVPIWTSN